MLYFCTWVYICICASLPYFFYKIIKLNYKLDNNYIFYLSLVIFISPYFRSSSIWLLGDNLSLIFFSISVLFFIKSINTKNELKNFFLCLLFIILCSYVRYYYSIFSIYYLLIFYRYLNKKTFFYLILFSLILALPAIAYFNFIFQNYNFFGTVNNFTKINLYSNALIIFSIFLFYLLPIIYNVRFKIFDHFKKNKNYFFGIFFILITLYLIDLFKILEIISFSPKGGGVFLKLFDYFRLDINLFMTLITFISIIILDYLFQDNRFLNYFLILTLNVSLPLFTLYQKYLDPLIFLLIFGLIKSDTLKRIIVFREIKLKNYFIYFFSFYLFSLIYYLKIT